MAALGQWWVWSSSLTRDWAPAPCRGSRESATELAGKCPVLFFILSLPLVFFYSSPCFLLLFWYIMWKSSSVSFSFLSLCNIYIILSVYNHYSFLVFLHAKTYHIHLNFPGFSSDLFFNLFWGGYIKHRQKKKSLNTNPQRNKQL